ncbi:four-carbon acid sugar kinase family protein [Halobacillus sp. ACCC02827]|uniref:four-carbon acid sugar kinase family protein n=1 Tax=Halobacillus sp. ACCC02827 TaxID=3052090 RepID=UPI0025703D98|nr:four-carbon acid sugar kinase family protein [Halobacillus sp. ACCC02827]WJE15259.1 four-carbon acid sugar kinase family protein [Halobacillus sp. ACCC02827]
MSSIVVLCDDLTGANATGVKLNKKGFKTATIIHGLPVPDAGYEAICLDTDSRYVSEDMAKSRVKAALEKSERLGRGEIYSKRVDSTLRGNIGSEMEAMLEFLGEDAVAVVVSSFPDSARTTIGGFLLVDNVPLQQTDVAADPVKPLTTSKVEEIIRCQTTLPITSVGLDVVMDGPDALKREIDDAKQHSKVICFDAVTEEHIELIAEVVKDMNGPILAVDPGPFTAAYASKKLNQVRTNEKYLITIGSATSQTGLQIDYYTQKTGVEPIYVDPARLATFSETWDQEVDRIVAIAEERLEASDILLVTTYHPGHKMLNLSQMAEEESTTEEGLAKRITDGLGVISRRLLQSHRESFKGCYLSGGDVTASVASITRAHGIELKDEILPLAAYGSFTGGYLDGMPIVTKGGMIGDKKALYTCMNYMISSTKNFN